MNPITFTAWYGGEPKTVQITQPNGAAGVYHVMIDKFYYGQLVRYEGGFHWYHNQPDEFTSDDIQILGRIVDEAT